MDADGREPELTEATFAAKAARGAVVGFTLAAGASLAERALRIDARRGRCPGTDFSRAELGGSRFSEMTFERCRFRAADLSDCRFERCSFFVDGTDGGCDFSFANLEGVTFERCDLTTARFINTHAHGISLHQCQAQGVDFTGADFSLALPPRHRANACQASFDACNLSYADFSRTDLTGCRLTENRMVHSLWHDASLERALLTGSTLDNIEGRGLTLRGADLRGCRFNNLDPRQIDLTDVQIELEQGLVLLRTLGIEVS